MKVTARPLYLTPWFYLLCIAGLAVVGAILHWYRVKTLRERVLEKKVESRTAQLRREKRTTEAQAASLREQKNRLQEQARKLHELDAAKSRFFANLSHEFRTPLTLILGPLRDVLQDAERALDAEDARKIRGAERSARRLLDLIDQLMALARLEAGQMQLQRGRHDLVQLARGITRAFEPWAERRRVMLQFSAAVRRLHARVDAEKLRRVLDNLLSNALGFTPAGGTVAVTVAEGDENAVLRVRDTGPGIPEDELSRIFDRFHQVSGAARREHEGTGIGLSLARELVELHGGAIRAESTPGEGATFTVTLPLGCEGAERCEEEWGYEPEQARRLPPALAGDGAAEGEHPEPEGAVPDGPMVLVVEDNAEVCAFLRGHLAAEYRVEEARHGAEALDAIRNSRPDLVVSDVMMPEMSGTELCRRLKADEALADVPIILLTARAGEAERIGGLNTGADDYIEKPFSVEELKARMRNLIESRAGLRERYGRSVRMEPTGLDITPEDETYYERARAVAEEHLRDRAFTTERFAEAMGASKSTLNRKLKDATGLTPAAFIRRLRLERAAQLLEAGRNVSETADAVGYDSAEHFSRLFREYHGTTPSVYAAEDEA